MSNNNKNDMSSLNEQEMQALLKKQEPILLDVIDRMEKFTAPSITPIYGNKAKNFGEVLGSGTFIELHGGVYLLTAQHVISKADNNLIYPFGLSHWKGHGRLVEHITRPWVEVEVPPDLAVNRIEDSVINDSSCTPLKVANFALNTKTLDKDLYFVHGWPGSQSHFTNFHEEGGGVAARPLHYGGHLMSSDEVSYDESVQFAITYPPCELPSSNGKTTTLPDPHGLSGSVVWKTNKAYTGEEWNPEMARIVGVTQSFNAESKCIFVTRIEYVREILLYAIRSDFAYFRWLNRGMPLHEDIDDWIAAEKAIQDI